MPGIRVEIDPVARIENEQFGGVAGRDGIRGFTSTDRRVHRLASLHVNGCDLTVTVAAFGE